MGRARRWTTDILHHGVTLAHATALHSRFRHQILLRPTAALLSSQKLSSGRHSSRSQGRSASGQPHQHQPRRQQRAGRIHGFRNWIHRRPSKVGDHGASGLCQIHTPTVVQVMPTITTKKFTIKKVLFTTSTNLIARTS